MKTIIFLVIFAAMPAHAFKRADAPAPVPVAAAVLPAPVPAPSAAPVPVAPVVAPKPTETPKAKAPVTVEVKAKPARPVAEKKVKHVPPVEKERLVEVEPVKIVTKAPPINSENRARQPELADAVKSGATKIGATVSGFWEKIKAANVQAEKECAADESKCLNWNNQ